MGGVRGFLRGAGAAVGVGAAAFGQSSPPPKAPLSRSERANAQPVEMETFKEWKVGTSIPFLSRSDALRHSYDAHLIRDE